MASLLIVVACLLAPLGVVAVWARNQVTNTDRYVATVAPPAKDPAIRQAVTVASFTHSQVARIVQSQAFADAWCRPTGWPTTSWSRPSPAKATPSPSRATR